MGPHTCYSLDWYVTRSPLTRCMDTEYLSQLLVAVLELALISGSSVKSRRNVNAVADSSTRQLLS